MTDILFLSDIHYGYDELVDTEVSQKLKEVRDYANDSSIEHVILLGDLIHESETKEADIRRLEEIKSIFSEFDLYAIPGNHDIINLPTTRFEKIFNPVPMTVELPDVNLTLVDSASDAQIDNLGFLAEDSLEHLLNYEPESSGYSLILSHYLLGYTSAYQQSKFFDRYPEGVFATNKSHLESQIDTEIYDTIITGHLHIRDSSEDYLPQETLNSFSSLEHETVAGTFYIYDTTENTFTEKEV